MEIIFRLLRCSSCGEPSLMIGRVCNSLVQVLLGLASAVIPGPKSRSRDHILLSHLRLSYLSVASYESQHLMPESKSKLSYSRQSVGQSVLVSGHHLGPATISFLFQGNSMKTFPFFIMVPSLRRGRICDFQCIHSSVISSQDS
jgi:hypothetical protein